MLPGLIIGLGLFNVGWIVAQTIINSMNVYNGNLNEIRYTNPRYYGQGGNGDRYTISGLEAVRKGMNATTISLKAPSMEFKSSDVENPTRVSAANGIFDQTTNKFTLTGHVVIAAGGSISFSKPNKRWWIWINPLSMATNTLMETDRRGI